MLENLQHGYGYSQQTYSSTQHQNWQNRYHKQSQSQSHHSGMPIVLMHQMMMLQGNHAMHQDVWRAQQNASWQTDNYIRRQQHRIAYPDQKYGHFNGGGAGNVTSVGHVASSGGNYPNLIASSEYECYSRVKQAPPAVRFEAMRSYEQSNWGSGGGGGGGGGGASANGHLFQSYHDGFNLQGSGSGSDCQSFSWTAKGI